VKCFIKNTSRCCEAFNVRLLESWCRLWSKSAILPEVLLFSWYWHKLQHQQISYFGNQYICLRHWRHIRLRCPRSCSFHPQSIGHLTSGEEAFSKTLHNFVQSQIHWRALTGDERIKQIWEVAPCSFANGNKHSKTNYVRVQTINFELLSLEVSSTRNVWRFGSCISNAGFDIFSSPIISSCFSGPSQDPQIRDVNTCHTFTVDQRTFAFASGESPRAKVNFHHERHFVSQRREPWWRNHFSWKVVRLIGIQLNKAVFQKHLLQLNFQ